MRGARRLVAIILLGCCGGCVNGLFYHPTRTVYQTPAQQRLAYAPVTFVSADGTRLSGWFVPAVGTAKGTVLHVHGNAQNMTAHFSFVDWLPAAGFNVFVFDYRGYGQSEGAPSRTRLVDDAQAALHYLRQRPGVDPRRIAVFGQSLGGAVAVAALAREPAPAVRAVALESALASYRGIVRDKIAQVPVVSLLRWPLSFLIVSNGESPDACIGRLAPVPLAIIHGTADRVVPYHNAQDLFARAGDPKALWTVAGGDHTEALVRFGKDYRPRLAAFFEASLAE